MRLSLLSEALDFEGPVPDEDQFSTRHGMEAYIYLPEAWTQGPSPQVPGHENWWPLSEETENDLFFEIEEKLLDGEEVTGITVHRMIGRRAGYSVWNVSWTVDGGSDVLEKLRGERRKLRVVRHQPGFAGKGEVGDVYVHVVKVYPV